MQLSLDDGELLGRIARGDEQAFEAIYHRYSKKIYYFALKVLHSEMLAEEVMQETMLKIWQTGEGLNAIKNLEAFIRTIVRNRSLNILRRLQMEAKVSREQGRDYEETHNDTEEQIILNDTSKVLRQAIELLPQQQKQVYQLCRVEGLKYGEAAELLNISSLTVATHMKLALRFLRNYMSTHTDIAILCLILGLL